MAKTIRELFVNRTKQNDAFRKMLDGQTSRRIMALTAAAGMGKSWLLQMFAQEAAGRKVPLVQIDFADGQAYDALLLARRCRDSIGPEYFNTLTQVINEATTARVTISTESSGPPPTVNVAVGEGNTDTSVTVSEVGTIVKDNFFVVQTDNPLVRQAIEDRINSAFFENLTALCAQSQVVFLFDTYERNSLESERWSPNAADRWVVGQLLTRMRDRKISNVIVVLAGRRVPEFGTEWNEVLGRMSLGPLECSDIKLYLQERRGLSVITDSEADRLCQAVGGNPQVLGMIGDNLEQANKSASQDDEW